MSKLERQVHEVLYNLNWLLEAHDSSAELLRIDGKKVIIKCVGVCAECDTNCVEIAFKEKIPEIELILQ